MTLQKVGQVGRRWSSCLGHRGLALQHLGKVCWSPGWNVNLGLGLLLGHLVVWVVPKEGLGQERLGHWWLTVSAA